MGTCKFCGSDDTEIYEAEHEEEDDMLHCYDCSSDSKIDPETQDSSSEGVGS